MKKKWKWIVPVLILAVLAFAFWYGGDAPGLRGWKTEPANAPTAAEKTEKQPEFSEIVQQDAKSEPKKEDEVPSQTQPESAQTPAKEAEPARPGDSGSMTVEETVDAAAALAEEVQVEPGDADYSESQGMVINPETGKDKYLTDPVPEGKPLPVEPQDTEITDTAYTCTISISCAAILDRMEWLDPEKVELVPADGWILEPIAVQFFEGESVFHVLQRVCKQNGIHMEFENTPMYNSAYIEGIHNLYEFDCGELSGWMYKVNGWFPNYGCSRYALKDGDVIEWVYTCDLGVDVGGFYATGG